MCQNYSRLQLQDERLGNATEVVGLYVKKIKGRKLGKTKHKFKQQQREMHIVRLLFPLFMTRRNDSCMREIFLLYKASFFMIECGYANTCSSFSTK